ncbi:MAG TPA: hypothetical protein VF796_01150 [Humisphaera sp.]
MDDPTRPDATRPTIPWQVYLATALCAAAGGWLGNLLCFGYDFVKGPFGPQAGVDPQPAGWPGWWIGGGAVLGGVAGFLAAMLVTWIARSAAGPRR